MRFSGSIKVSRHHKEKGSIYSLEDECLLPQSLTILPQGFLRKREAEHQNNSKLLPSIYETSYLLLIKAFPSSCRLFFYCDRKLLSPHLPSVQAWVWKQLPHKKKPEPSYFGCVVGAH